MFLLYEKSNYWCPLNSSDLFVSSIRGFTQLEKEMNDTYLGRSSLYHIVISLIKKKSHWKFQTNGKKDKHFLVRVLSFLDRKYIYLLHGKYTEIPLHHVTSRYRELEKE